MLLKNLIDVIVDNRGKNPPYYSNSGIPIIDNYLIQNNYYPNVTLVKRFINKDVYSTFIRDETKKDDILITLVGNGYGSCCLCPDNIAIIQNTIGLRANKKFVHSKYLYYNLLSIKQLIKGLNRGATQPSIKVSDLLGLDLNIHNLSTQQHIVDTITSYHIFL